MTARILARRAAASVAVAAAVLPVGAAAGAAAPPAVPAPPAPYVQSVTCIAKLPAPTKVANGISWAQRTLEYTQAWRFSRGQGVKVAVIDTGVNPEPSFGGRLVGLADLVDPSVPGPPGLTDCDGHGTLVAGIVGAGEDLTSGFAGVAPDATILSIRQSSENYQTKSQQAGGGATPGEASGAGTRESLARAIDYAVAQGAQVINISEADCQAYGNADLPALTAAVTAAVARNVVVVAAAGNITGDGACKQQNVPGRAAATAAAPADINSPGLLTVGALTEAGTPATFSLAGPWVDVAAPGSDITATDPYPSAGGQVDSISTANGTGPIAGTSFAAPYVAGLVALVRARYPALTPAQVVTLIERTAAHPAAPADPTTGWPRNDYVGYGLVDPVAALSAPMPGPTQSPDNPAALSTVHLHRVSTHPRNVALIGSLAAAGVLLLLGVVTLTRRSRRRPLAR